MWTKSKAVLESNKFHQFFSRSITIATNVICLVFIVVSAFPASYHVASQEQYEDKFIEMNALVNRIMEEDNIPGVSVVIVQGNETVFAKGYGITSINNPQPVDEKTIFTLASVSKSFTALGVLLLRDEGMLDIDKPVVYYLPDFSMANKEDSDKITVRQLLTHTSGIGGSMAEPLGYFDGPHAMSEMVADLGGLTLNNHPGDTFQYSNLNYFLLGAVVEAASGQLFEDYMQEAVFTPLGLTRTTLKPEQAEEWGSAYGHQPVFGQIVERSMPVYRSATPAGWVMSNATDMSRWLELFLNEGSLDGNQLIKSETIKEMLTPATFYKKDGNLIGYGMGWLINTDSNGITRMWHGGDSPSFLADMIILPDYEVGVAVMVNSQTGTQGHSIAPGLVNIFLDIELEQIHQPWWAHWETIDAFSFPIFILVLLLLIGLGLFLWRVIHKIRSGNYIVIKRNVRAKLIPPWLFALYNAPLASCCLLIAIGYAILNWIYGYNIFKVVGDIFLVAPPSIWIAVVSMTALVLLWSLTLSATAIVIRYKD
jgi:putative ATP-binding cassette transporter